MSLRNVKPWILHARRAGVAVGAYNANTMEQMQAIVLAAQDENAPAIMQVSHHALQYAGSGSEILGLRYMAELGKVAAASVTVPIALHLDHANEQEVLQAIALGFTSVMFDGSDLPFEENIATTRRLREIAHSVGVCIEAELGEVPRADKTGFVDHDSALTSPEAAAEFVAATGVDTLAIAIGSIHAIREKHVELDLERLTAIRALVDIPLVLHGSSGVTDASIAEGIRRGLCKINVATQLTKAFTGALREALAGDIGEVDPRKVLGPAREAMREAVRERMRFFGASGLAAVVG